MKLHLQRTRPASATVSPHPPCSATNRRGFLKLLCAGTATAASGASATPAATSPTPAAASLPRGKIGNLEVSRLILGTNHITFHMHSRDLGYVRDLSRHYNTEEKVLDTFAAAEANGVTAFMTHSDPRIERLFRTYRERRGGKMKWIVAPWLSGEGTVTDLAGYQQLVPRLLDSGVDALYVPGMLTGVLVQQGKGRLIGEMLGVIKDCGVPAGVASHGLDVVRFCEQEKLPVDFFVKTFHHLKYPTAPSPEEMKRVCQSTQRYPRGDLKSDYAEVPGYWCSNPEETAKVMKTVTKPWIAFKVMAAGAIPPRDAFRYAYANGADFILAGMFDFQIAEDARITRDVIAILKKRPRPWHG